MIEKLNLEDCIHILEQNYIGYLSYIAQRTPHTVPVTYFFDKNTNCLIFYSAQGEKINAMRNYNWVSLLVTEISSINYWNSVLVKGKFNELEGLDAKVKLHDFSLGVKDLIRIKEHKKMNFLNEFSSRIFKNTTPIVYQVEELEISGRLRRS